MIKPSPGRIVWYRHLPGDGIIGHNDDPLAAIVAGVHSDTLLNLSVIGADGTHHARRNVTLVQDGEPAPGQACWMPYQRGQAAKLDAVLGAGAEPKAQAADVNKAPTAAEVQTAETEQPQPEAAPQG